MESSQSEWLTPRELAERIKLTPGGVKNKIAKLGEADGVVRWGARCTRIDWNLFEARLKAGILGKK